MGLFGFLVITSSDFRKHTGKLQFFVSITLSPYSLAEIIKLCRELATIPTGCGDNLISLLQLRA